MSPEGAPLNNPGDIEKTLADMWKPPQNRQVLTVATRICAANLIVVTRPEDWHNLNNDLGELSTLFPTRTIAVILHENESDFPPPQTSSIHASVSAICHIPLPGRPQVCAEQIVLHNRLDQTFDLHHTILPMLEADLPCLLWWRIDTPQAGDLCTHLEKLTDRIILDAGLAGLQSLETKTAPTVRELGWYRTYPYRELIAQMFDKAPADTFARIHRLSIEIPSNNTDQLIEAFWLVAFIAGQLNWQPLETTGPGQYLFSGINCNVEVTITGPIDETKSQTPGLQQLTIESNGHTFMICRCCPDTHEYRAVICDQRLCEIPRCLQVPRQSRGEALASAATGRTRDYAFQRAAPVAAWLAKDISQ